MSEWTGLRKREGGREGGIPLETGDTWAVQILA